MLDGTYVSICGLLLGSKLFRSFITLLEVCSEELKVRRRLKDAHEVPT